MKSYKAGGKKKMSNDKNINNDHERRITRVEVTIENINQTLSRMELKLDQGFKEIRERIWFNFYWMLGGFTSILVVIAHIEKWI